LGPEDKDFTYETGQQWFDQWKEFVESLRGTLDAQTLADEHPKASLLLEMLTEG
jgi:hypothetical protein